MRRINSCMEKKIAGKRHELYKLDRSEKKLKLIVGPIMYLLSCFATGYSDLAYTSRILSWGISSDTWEMVSIKFEKMSYK